MFVSGLIHLDDKAVPMLLPKALEFGEEVLFALRLPRPR